MKATPSSNLPLASSSAQAPGTLTRRRFLNTAAAALAAVNIVPLHVISAPGRSSPNSKMNLAGIGIGGVGYPQLQSCESAGFNIAALCDVDDLYAKKAYDHWPQARRYRDFRELLQSEGDRIDAVYIGTPDHTHAIITLAALRLKKHICCVKPLTRTIQENRVVMEAARKAGVATQVTAAPNTSESACRTCELIWAGAIGPVREVHVWSNRPLWPQGMLRPAGHDQVPETLDWNLWIGPAPMRPFKSAWPDGDLALQQIAAMRGNAPFKAVYHPWNFRGWWDFGTGALGDMGCHHLNPVFRALKLEHPVRVQATSTRLFPETAPLASIVTLDYPARGQMPPTRVVWYDGNIQPPAPQELEGRPLPDEGMLYIGDEGKMLGAEIIPSAKAKKFSTVPRTLPRRGGTWLEWVEACQGGEKAGCDFDSAGLLTETVLLGNLAIRIGKPLDWDAARGQFTNNTEANALVSEAYHNGWKLEA
jgi:predicted dehydrogenase